MWNGWHASQTRHVFFFWPNEHFPSAAYTAFPKDLDARLLSLSLHNLVYHGVVCLTDFVPVNVERDDSSMLNNFEIEDNEQQSTATRTPHKESARDETNRRFVVDFILAVISSIPISIGTTLFRDGCCCHVWGIFGWFLWVVLTYWFGSQLFFPLNGQRDNGELA